MEKQPGAKKIADNTDPLSYAMGVFIREAAGARSLMELNGIAASGLRFKSLKKLIAFYGFTNKEIATVAGVCQQAVSKWDGATILNGQRAKRFMVLDGIAKKGIEIFGEEKLFRKWLGSPIHCPWR